jgi:hypothetical protein
MTYRLCTRHAAARAQQRGIKPAHIDAVIRYGDLERRRGRGCMSISISRRELSRLGPITPEGIPTDKLRGLTVLQAGDQACVTVFRNHTSKTYRHHV